MGKNCVLGLSRPPCGTTAEDLRPEENNPLSQLPHSLVAVTRPVAPSYLSASAAGSLSIWREKWDSARAKKSTYD